ncbi:hypothetical protein B0H14DRAFT_2864786 [Mycena olivaceomarginata]|nr:hypothetical protein B0H14DRAFT_2864786 [Mycena olivaceomarginata]
MSYLSVSTDNVIHNDNNPRGLFSLCQNAHVLVSELAGHLALNPEKLVIPWPVFRGWVVRVLAGATFRINTCAMVGPRRIRTALLHWHRLRWILEVSIRHPQRHCGVLRRYPGGCSAAQVAKHVYRCHHRARRSHTGYILLGTFLFFFEAK